MHDAINEAAVRREILLGLEYSYAHDDWVTPLDEALQGVGPEEAIWKPTADLRCIWEIVRHVTVWAENSVERMAQRLRGELPGRPAEGDWPLVPAEPTEAAWEADQKRLLNALDDLRASIETTPLSAMLDKGEATYSHLSDLLCRFTHNGYHIGQITILRAWYAASQQK